MALEIVKDVRVESVEDARGRIRDRSVTVWAIVDGGGGLVSEWDRKRDAVAALAGISAARRHETARANPPAYAVRRRLMDQTLAIGRGRS